MIIQAPPPPAYNIYMPVVKNELSKNQICMSSNTCDFLLPEPGSNKHFMVKDEGIFNDIFLSPIVKINGVAYRNIESFHQFMHPEETDLMDGEILIHLYMDETYFCVILEKV